MLNESSQKPTLKRVIVASGTKVAIGDDIEEALKNLSSSYAVDIEVDNSENIENLVNSIIKANQNVQNSSKSGDWKLFGEDMQSLTNLIKELQEAVKKQQEEEKAANNVTSENTVVNNTVVNNTTGNIAVN